MSGQSRGCVCSVNWQRWGGNHYAELRKPGQEALGRVEPCFWNLRGAEDVLFVALICYKACAGCIFWLQLHAKRHCALGKHPHFLTATNTN